MNWQQDPHGNWLARFVFPEKATELKIEVDLVADMTVINPFDFFVEDYAETFPFAYPPELAEELAACLVRDEGGPRLDAYVASLKREPMRVIDFLVGLNAKLQSDISYLIRMEPGVQSPEETLILRSGSCRDSAWLMVQVLRQLGLRCAFRLRLSGAAQRRRRSAGQAPRARTATSPICTHGAEVYLPGAGWVGLDPTSGLFCGEGHMPVCAAPHYSAAAPISGLVEPAKVDFDFSMKVTRVREAPRVTRPFSDESWEKLDALGEIVDKDLHRARRAPDHGRRADVHLDR